MQQPDLPAQPGYDKGKHLGTRMTIKKTWKRERRVYIYKCEGCSKNRQTYKRKKTRELCRLCKKNWVNPNQQSLFPGEKVEVIQEVNKATGQPVNILANGIQLLTDGKENK